MNRQIRVTIAAIVIMSLTAQVAFADDVKPELPKVTPNSSEEPLAREFSLQKSAAFLDGVAGAWTRERKCGTCHTNYPYLMARPALLRPNESAPIHDEIRAFFENRVANWDKDKQKPRWDAEVVATVVCLAINDAHSAGKLHPLTRQALDRMFTVQKPTGGFEWLKCNWPPMEHDDYFGALFAAVGIGAAPDNYAQSEKARAGLDKLRQYFKSNPPPDLHHKAMLLWASQKLDGLMTQADQEAAIRELFAAQNGDGGWSLPGLGYMKRRDGSANDPEVSDGYGTGYVIYMLRQAGIPATDERIQRGVAWLKSHQRESGRWFTRSVNNDKAHYITNAGTSYAVLALTASEVATPAAEQCEPAPPISTRVYPCRRWLGFRRGR